MLNEIDLLKHTDDNLLINTITIILEIIDETTKKLNNAYTLSILQEIKKNYNQKINVALNNKVKVLQSNN